MEASIARYQVCVSEWESSKYSGCIHRIPRGQGGVATADGYLYLLCSIKQKVDQRFGCSSGIVL